MELQTENKQDFYKHLFEKVMSSLPNDYEDNYDFVRFGAPKRPASASGKLYSSPFFQKRFFIKSTQLSQFSTARNLVQDPDFGILPQFYDLLADDQSRQLLIDIVAFRILGHKKVRLPLSTPEYWQKLDKIAAYKKKPAVQAQIPDADNKGLGNYDMSEVGYNIKLDAFKEMILVDFVLEQYKYQSPTKTIQVEPGNIVLDCGGFWGDTALYFAHKAGANGKVFTFEFIPNNLRVLNANLEQNPHLKNNISIVPNPVWEKADVDIYFTDRGPASSISFSPEDANAQLLKTTSVDQLVASAGLTDVNFIKMDIEGAEPNALRGAENTIRKYKPTLAIAIYHSLSDFVHIPQYLHSLNLGYKFYLGHYTIFEEETILFATIN